MDLQMFRLRIQRAIGVAAGTSGDEQLLVDSWVNEAIEQFLIKTKVTREFVSMAFTNGIGDYEISGDILAWEDPQITLANPALRNYTLRPVDSSEIVERRLAATSIPSADPYLYAFEGARLLMVYPNARSSSDKLTMLVVRQPTAKLDTADDDPSGLSFGGIPSEYHPVLEAYAKWKAAEYSNDSPSGHGQSYKEEWERGVMSAKIDMTRKGGIRVGSVKIGRYPHYDPRLPGIDYG